MKDIVNWSDIIAECGDYRKGFVAIFRRYEGQPTDELDAYGRRVKVTAASFAAHVGIANTTFDRWLKMVSGAEPISRTRSKNDLTRDVTRAARHEPTSVVDGIMAAPAPTQTKIIAELAARRVWDRSANETSKADRKASEARTHETLQPVRRGMAATHMVLAVAALRDAKEHLVAAMAEGAFDEAARTEFDEAWDELAITLAEARFAAS